MYRIRRYVGRDVYGQKAPATRPGGGWLVILRGVVIILALILPAGFWWFALAVALIIGGIWLLRSCR